MHSAGHWVYTVQPHSGQAAGGDANPCSISQCLHNGTLIRSACSVTSPLAVAHQYTSIPPSAAVSQHLDTASLRRLPSMQIHVLERCSSAAAVMVLYVVMGHSQ